VTAQPEAPVRPSRASRVEPPPLIDRIGARYYYPVRDLLSIALLPYRALKGAVLEGRRGRRLVIEAVARQVYFTAVRPLAFFSLIAFVIGLVVVVGSDALLRANGLTNYIPAVVATGLCRELLPLVLTLVLIARSGTAIAIELGYMRVTQEIDALDASGINLDYFLVLPRVLGLVISAFGLVAVMSAVGVVGGFITAQVFGFVSVALRLHHITTAITFGTIVVAGAKAALCGLIIGTVSCFHGLSVGRVHTEIPQANTRATVFCLLLCLVVNGVLSVLALV
jgi:phospholipid/cholesterol/gamma-HCH transport system permease protein